MSDNESEHHYQEIDIPEYGSIDKIRNPYINLPISNRSSINSHIYQEINFPSSNRSSINSHTYEEINIKSTRNYQKYLTSNEPYVWAKNPSLLSVESERYANPKQLLAKKPLALRTLPPIPLKRPESFENDYLDPIDFRNPENVDRDVHIHKKLIKTISWEYEDLKTGQPGSFDPRIIQQLKKFHLYTGNDKNGKIEDHIFTENEKTIDLVKFRRIKHSFTSYLPPPLPRILHNNFLEFNSEYSRPSDDISKITESEYSSPYNCEYLKSLTRKKCIKRRENSASKNDIPPLNNIVTNPKNFVPQKMITANGENIKSPLNARKGKITRVGAIKKFLEIKPELIKQERRTVSMEDISVLEYYRDQYFNPPFIQQPKKGRPEFVRGLSEDSQKCTFVKKIPPTIPRKPRITPDFEFYKFCIEPREVQQNTIDAHMDSLILRKQKQFLNNKKQIPIQKKF